ncbi:ATP-grasp domain-containing protein [Pediococcus stilesii]|uniref:ATP-grasp domain-containing protein n=1 Tax=Pediococcus stilesii TaxID=331679 RepID=A0A5R9BU46_9LACO|nr:ATP-grasp domain-containing protein [Pediococcus stilesii]TLQ04184.1 ATP-grasp domain-containing protein [Pediococcus stilesii]
MARIRSKKILIIGAGPTQVGRDTESEAAAIQIIKNFAEAGRNLYYVTNDANSIIPQLKYDVEFLVDDLTVNSLIQILRENDIDIILPVVGNTVALQLCEQLNESEVLKELNIRTMGVTTTTIHNINNPELMNKVLRHIKEPTIPTTVVETANSAIKFAKRVGFPVLIKPIASLTKTNRIKCDNEHQLVEMLEPAFKVSTTNQIAVEKSVVGYKEVEMTVIRDAEGSKLLINGAENFNPIGVHSGDSIIFSPTQTLTDIEFQSLRTAALKIAEVLKIKGVCHVQFALDPTDGKHFVTRVNPFFDRTSAFAARATGYPIANVVSKILLGQSLREIELSGVQKHDSLALIEPAMDHVAVRFPTWSFASFKNADQELNTKMKSTGAVMSFGRSAEEALQKAIRSVDSTTTAEQAALDESELSEAQLINVLIHARAGEVYYLLEALRRGYTVDELAEMTHIDAFYFYKLRHLVKLERQLREHHFDADVLKEAKYFGFGDTQIAHLWQVRSDQVREFRIKQAKVFATYKGVEPTAGEFPYLTNTYYSTFEDEDEAIRTVGKKILVLGTANSQVGTNSAAEYTTFQTIKRCQDLGYKVILINNNPNALTFVPDLADKVYLEPLTVENCLNIIHQEKPDKIVAQGKWEIVSQLVLRGVEIDQLPLSRTTRSENIDADYMAVVSEINGQANLFGVIGINDENMFVPIEASPKIKRQFKAVVMEECKNLTANGIYSIILRKNDDLLEVSSSVPMAIQDLPFLSYVLNQDFAGMITEIILTGAFQIKNYPMMGAKYRYTHVYPYDQFGIKQPQNTPFSLAIGAKFLSN